MIAKNADFVKERKMNIENLRVILDKHKKWLFDEEGGERALRDPSALFRLAFFG